MKCVYQMVFSCLEEGGFWSSHLLGKKRSVANLQNRMYYRNKCIKKQIRRGFLGFFGFRGSGGVFLGRVGDFCLFVFWFCKKCKYK